MTELYERSLETVGEQSAGTLRIGTIDSLAAYYLPPFLKQLKRLNPKLNIQLQPDTEESLIRHVKDGEADVGLLLEREPADSALHCMTVREEPLVIVVPPGHPLERFDSLHPDNLEGAAMIVSEASCVYRDFFERVMKKNQISYRIEFELGSLEAIKQCVINGLGVGLLPQIAALEEHRDGRLKAIPLIHPQLTVGIQLLVHPKKWRSQPLQQFIDMLIGRGHANRVDLEQGPLRSFTSELE